MLSKRGNLSRKIHLIFITKIKMIRKPVRALNRYFSEDHSNTREQFNNLLRWRSEQNSHDRIVTTGECFT